jgi:hypothetical protein
MSRAQALETTRIHRVAGLTGGRTSFVTTRPFRAPHHTISDVGMIGGGQRPMPEEVSPAHHGILFWMSYLSSSAMSSRCCGSRWRRVSHEYNFPCVVDLAALVERIQGHGRMPPLRRRQ